MINRKLANTNVNHQRIFNKIHTSRIFHMDMCRNSIWLLTISSSMFSIYDTYSLKSCHTVANTKNDRKCLWWPLDTGLFVSNNSNTLHIWDTKNLKIVEKYDFDNIYDMDIGNINTLIAVSCPNSVNLVDLSIGSSMHTLRSPSFIGFGLVHWSQISRNLLCSTSKNNILFWDIRNSSHPLMQTALNGNEEIIALNSSTDSQFYGFLTQNGIFYLFDVLAHSILPLDLNIDLFEMELNALIPTTSNVHRLRTFSFLSHNYMVIPHSNKLILVEYDLFSNKNGDDKTVDFLTGNIRINAKPKSGKTHYKSIRLIDSIQGYHFGDITCVLNNNGQNPHIFYTASDDASIMEWSII